MNGDQIRGNQRLAGQVKRYHTWPTLRDQNIAEHSWQIMRIYYQLFGEPDRGVYTFIMYHDAGEIGCGDPPYPIKAKNPVLKEIMDRLENETLEHMGAPRISLGEELKIRVKICDLLEMWEFGAQEVAMGNKLASPIVSGMSDAIFKMAAALEKFVDGEGETVWVRLVKHMEDFQRCMT